VIDAPPFAGAVKFTVTCAFPATTDTMVGAPGTVAGTAGVIATEAADDGPLPALLVAYTLQVYGSPFVSPVTMIGLEAFDAVPETEPAEADVQVAV
jgi:hypothetical protein